MVGYQFRTETVFLKLFAGIEAEDQRISPRDPDNAVQGSALGLKLAAEGWFDISPLWFASLDASYGTAFQEYWSLARIGRRLRPRLSLGLEGGALGNEEYDAGRGGGFVRADLRAVELTLANNRALRADLEVIGQAKADLVQAGLLSNPVLSLMFGFPEAGGLSKIDFGLSKDFADLWLIPSRKRAAVAMLQQRVLSLTDTAIQLATEVRTVYANLQYQSEGWTFLANYGEFYPEQLGIREHDQTNRRGLVKVAQHWTPLFETYAIAMVETTLPQAFAPSKDRTGIYYIVGCQFSL